MKATGIVRRIEGAYICCSRSCRKKRLGSGEDKSYICFYSFGAEYFNSLESLKCHWYFNYDIFMDFNELPCLLTIPSWSRLITSALIGPSTICRYFFINLNKVSAFFGNNRGICRNSRHN